MINANVSKNCLIKILEPKSMVYFNTIFVEFEDLGTSSQCFHQKFSRDFAILFTSCFQPTKRQFQNQVLVKMSNEYSYTNLLFLCDQLDARKVTYTSRKNRPYQNYVNFTHDCSRQSFQIKIQTILVLCLSQQLLNSLHCYSKIFK